MYFDMTLRLKMLKQMLHLLAPGGFFVVGTQDRLPDEACKLGLQPEEPELGGAVDERLVLPAEEVEDKVDLLLLAEDAIELALDEAAARRAAPTR